MTEGSHGSFEQIAMRTKPQAPDFGVCKSGIMRSSSTSIPSCTLTFTGGEEEADLREEVRLSGSEKIWSEIRSQVTGQDRHNQKINTAALTGLQSEDSGSEGLRGQQLLDKDVGDEEQTGMEVRGLLRR